MFGGIGGLVLAHERHGCDNSDETKAFCYTASVAWEVWYEQSVACKSCLPFSPWLIRCYLAAEDEVNYLGASDGWINEHSLQCVFLGLSICGIVLLTSGSP